MTRDEWLNSLKVGDKVAISARYGRGYIGIFEITRETKTLFMIATESTWEYKFKKLDGYEQGSSMRRICQVTPEIEDELLRDKLLKQISDSETMRKLKTETLKQIYEIMTNENI